jgi:hypothetical protein
MRTVRLKGIPGTVEVNKDGTVIRHEGEKCQIYLLTPAGKKKGYYSCRIAGRLRYVHRIVAEAFVHNPRPLVNKMVIHINGDRLDNHYKNLLWTNPQSFYKVRKELGNPVINYSHKNRHRRANSPISHKQAKKIAKRLDNGEFAKDICKEYGVSEMSISRIRKRYCKQKQASPRYDKTIKETVRKLALKHPSGEVARITGINYHTVYRWLKGQKRTYKDQ